MAIPKCATFKKLATVAICLGISTFGDAARSALDAARPHPDLRHMGQPGDDNGSMNLLQQHVKGFQRRGIPTADDDRGPDRTLAAGGLSPLGDALLDLQSLLQKQVAQKHPIVMAESVPGRTGFHGTYSVEDDNRWVHENASRFAAPPKTPPVDFDTIGAGAAKAKRGDFDFDLGDLDQHAPFGADDILSMQAPRLESLPGPSRDSIEKVGGVTVSLKPERLQGDATASVFEVLQSQADAHLREETERLRSERSALRQHQEADSETLNRFQDTVAELKRQNSALLDREQLALRNAQQLQIDNAYLLRAAGSAESISRAEPPEEPASQAEIEGESSPSRESVSKSTNSESAEKKRSSETVMVQNIFDMLARILNDMELGQLTGPACHTFVILLVTSTAAILVYMIENDALQWHFRAQIAVLAFVGLVYWYAWHLASSTDSNALLIAATLVIYPFMYCIGLLWRTFKAYDGTDFDGDGDVDWHDRLQAFRKTGQSVSLFIQTVSSMLPLFVVGFGGFAFLWWMGFLQPVARDLVVYAYFAILLVAGLVIFIFRIWRSLNTSILQFFEQFKMFQHQAEDIIQDIPEHIKKVIDDWRNGERTVEPFEDRSLANLHRDPFLTLPSPGVGAHLADVSNDPFLTADSADRRRILGMLCDFAEILFDKFKDVNDAFTAFDVNKNGMLSRKEFKDGTRQLPAFKGDAAAIFRALDPGRLTGRLTGRLSKHDFRKLKDIHEEQADGKKRLGDAAEVLTKALNGDAPIAPMFQDPQNSGIFQGGEAWALQRSLEYAREKGVGGPVLLEADHTLFEATQTRELEAMVERVVQQRDFSKFDEIDQVIRTAEQNGVQPHRVRNAHKSLKDAEEHQRGPSKKRPEVIQ